MLYREISRILGNYLFYFALVLCLPFGIAIYYEFIANPLLHPQPHSSAEFLETILLCLGVAALFRFFGRKAKKTFFRRESIILVAVIWVISSLVGALPFYLTKTLENPVDAYFEAISGFTTTGASMMTPKAYNKQGEEIPITITDSHTTSYTYKGTITPVRDPETNAILFSGVEAVGKAVLFWRSFMQWLGGMGIVVLFLTVLPALGVGGKFLYQMEMTGPVKEGVSPRIKETASLLWKLYLSLTLLQIILLLWTNPSLPFFDAICISFSTLSTGGFAVKNNSIASYSSPSTEWVILLFMILGSINFGLYFHIIRAKFYRIYVPDFFLFMVIVWVSSLIVSYYLFKAPTNSLSSPSLPYSLTDSIREGSFQTISAQTSTGFTTANYSLWPFPTQMFMLLLMFVGGMSGATCGGMKTSRIYILYKIIVHRLESLFRPETVRILRIGKMEIDPPIAGITLVFFCVAIGVSVLGTVLYILDGIDPETSFGLTACMMNNIGMAFRAAGPTGSFGFMSSLSKLLSTAWMVLGRLEFFALLILLFPGFWKGK